MGAKHDEVTADQQRLLELRKELDDLRPWRQTARYEASRGSEGHKILKTVLDERYEELATEIGALRRELRDNTGTSDPFEPEQ
jgi:uncharacterized protein involved in exopolysaccharide biosynthesis